LPSQIIKSTNDDGIIAQKNYDVVKSDDVFRILIIGDSFTEGMYVAFEETYPKKLENMLNMVNPCRSFSKYEVINLGVGGYDIEYAAARVLSRGIKYNPDLVIWLLKDDDFIERAEINFDREERYIDVINNQLEGDVNKFDQYQRWISDFKYEKYLGGIVHGIVVKEQIEQESYISYYDKQSSASLRVVTALNAPIILATFRNTAPIFKARMKVWANTHKTITYFSDIPELQMGTHTFEPFDGHPNSAGHTVLAESIYRSVIGIGACSSLPSGRLA